MEGMIVVIILGFLIHFYIHLDPFKTTDRLISLGERIRESRKEPTTEEGD